MIVTDLVCQEIREHIASHRPERGGALYGPRHYPMVTHFEYDFDARTSAVSYVPSDRLIANVAVVEREAGLQFKGIVHSHPRGLVRPSAGDERTVLSFFAKNPQFAAIALPIVQPLPRSRAPQSEPVPSPDLDPGAAPSFLHWYRAERGAAAARPGDVRRDAVTIVEEPLHVLPILAHVERLLAGLARGGLALTCNRKLQHLEIAGSQLVGLVCSGPAQREFMYFVGLGYPVVAPLVLYQHEGATRSLAIEWDGITDAEASVERIAALLYAAMGGPDASGPAPRSEPPRAAPAQPSHAT
ncbi:Mov34/MPN/PAD-1 family protein [Burkholderia perseverans]|uniref:Mov34/MPN/PAD-1 family protein n=1 Tax=Burkholderia perseverans TaxID=2615214 RepID=UPI001FEF53C2|nr:Mov34/MPN/PAD-1 family protein [Burkholderia perseverans]